MSEEEHRRVNLPYGFDGVMFALGKHVNQYMAFKNYTKYSGIHHFEPHVTVILKCLAYQLTTKYHWETLGMRRTLECFDEKVPICVGGDEGLTKSVNCTVNLANLAHYDCNDKGVGIGAWLEKEKHLSTEMFFVMPNVMVIEKNENGLEVKKTRSGLIVRLRDGCVISWDGTSIRHCTSIRMDPKN